MHESEPSISRREFASISAAAAGALLASGTGRTESISGAQLTDVYAFLVDNVDDSYEIPSLVSVASDDGFESLETLGVDYQTYSGDDQVAYAKLTPSDAEAVAGSQGVTELSYTPGANPFWKLGDYDDRVFPAPGDSVDYLAYDEVVTGLEYLADEHADRLAVERFGRGAGHENLYEDEEQSLELLSVELTEDVDDADDRETIVFGLSIHGDERAGIEAGVRFIEDILTGEEPAIEELLSSYRLVFVCPNPDGWIVRERLYENPVSPPDFRRYNGANRDPNRQFPVPGWIDPGHAPAEPDGANLTDDGEGVDDDVPGPISSEVPDVLSLVDHLRTYDDVSYLVDMHGMYANSNAVLGLGTGGGTPRDRADELLLFEAVESEFEETLGGVDEWTDAFEAGAEMTREQIGCPSEFFCKEPETMFGYGTPADTIGYTTTGAFESWAGAAAESGGLDATAVTLEIVFSNSTSRGMANLFRSALTEFHVAAYQSVCRAVVEHAASDIDAQVRTNGRTTAYLDTETVTRSAADLQYYEPSGVSMRRTEGGPGSSLTTESATLSAASPETTLEATEETHTLSVEVRSAPGVPVTARLRGPDGDTVASEDLDTPSREPPCQCTFSVVDPDPGAWTLEAETDGRATAVDVRTTRLDAQEQPDPQDALGYEQRGYEVTPLAVFDALEADADGSVDPVPAADLSTEMLVADGLPRYDNLVVTHSAVDEEGIAAIEAFVEAGGNLVLTDAGVELTADLSVAGLDAVTAENISEAELGFADYGEEWEPHPLFLDRTEWPDSGIAQREAWQHTQLGYAINQIPVYSVDIGPLDSTGANVALDVFGEIRAATIPTTGDRTGVHLIGTLLPPASQENLHPFGLADQTLTMFGYKLLCNALGYEFVTSRDGQQAQTFGEPVEPSEKATPTPTPTPTPTATPTETPTATPAETATPTGTETPSPTATATPGETVAPTQTATPASDADGVGFGLLAGLAGLGGASYLLGHMDDEEDDST